jgi:hypothetical protein
LTALKEQNTKFRFLGLIAVLLVACQTVTYQDSIRTKEQILGNAANLEADIVSEMKKYDVKAV